jgi:hypothetical protein
MIALARDSSPKAENIHKNEYTYYTCCCWCGHEDQCGYLLVKGRHYQEALCDRCATHFLSEPVQSFDWTKEGF